MNSYFVLRALLSHWWRHPLELVTLLVGLGVATALWSGVQALNAEARASYDRAAAVLDGEQIASVRAQSGGAVSVADYVSLRRAGWPVSPVIDGNLRIGESTLRVIGIEPLTLPPQAETLQVETGTERFTDFLRPPGIAYVAPETLAKLDPDGLPELAIADNLPPDTLLVDIGIAEGLLQRPGEISRFVIAADEVPGPLPVELAGRLEIAMPSPDSDMARLTDSFHLNLTAFGLLSFIVGLFIVYSAIGLAFERRKPTIRTIRACGVSARDLTLVMCFELVLIALVAGLAGVLAGYAIAAALIPDVAASLRGLYGAQVPGSLSLSATWWVSGIGISVLGALAASAAGLWRAAHLPLLATAQPQAWLGAERRKLGIQLLAALLVTLGTLGFLIAGDGLISGFAVMGGLLLAAALALPALLAGILSIGERNARSPLGQWIWADSRQQLSGLSLALMALLLALAVNVGVGTMVGSFRQTFIGYLDQRLASELYLSASDDNEAAEMTEWLANRPEVSAILPIWRADGRFEDWPLEVFGFLDHATYRDNWPLISSMPDPWQQVARGEGILISEQMARRFDFAPGDQINLAVPTGRWQTTIAAIYADYGNPVGQIMVGLEAFDDRWPDADRSRMAVRVAPDAVGPLALDLRVAFDLEEDATIDQGALKALSRSIFERTFAVTVALNALTFIVAGIALLTSLLTLGTARLGQMAPIWALGLTRARLARIEMAKTLGLATLTAICALPLGLAVAWVLTAVVNVQAFGWRLPVYLFPGQWLLLGLMAVGTAFLAALWPVWQLHKASPMTLLQRFSNER